MNLQWPYKVIRSKSNKNILQFNNDVFNIPSLSSINSIFNDKPKSIMVGKFPIYYKGYYCLLNRNEPFYFELKMQRFQ